jgi:antitoxin (DNA-binding transcriptional repressor) of toxin-antitoxin stability system
MIVCVREKAQLSQLLDLIEEGQEVIIARHGRPID